MSEAVGANDSESAPSLPSALVVVRATASRFVIRRHVGKIFTPLIIQYEAFIGRIIFASHVDKMFNGSHDGD